MRSSTTKPRPFIEPDPEQAIYDLVSWDLPGFTKRGWRPTRQSKPK